MHAPASGTLSRVTSKAFAVGLACSLLLSACAPATAPAPAAPAPAAPAPAAPAPTLVPAKPTVESPRRGGTLTIAAVADPAHFDVQQEPSINISMLTAPAYNNLLYYDPQTGSKIVPELAEQWEVSPDGLTYTFKIRKGVTFHDGTPLTVDDVVVNLERMAHPPKGVLSNVAFLLGSPIGGIQAAGNDSVKINMKFPFAPLTSTLVIDYMPMYSRKSVETQGHMKNAIMGTGPFKFKSYTPGVGLELVKNDKYWVKDRPYLDGITFSIIKDTATRLAALRTGQAKQSGRLFGAVTPTEAATLKKDIPGMQFVPSPSVIGPWFFMNLRSPPFKDERVRQAVNLAIDRQAAIKVIAEGEGVVGNFFPFEGWGIPRDELLKMPGYRQPKDQDIAQAKKLLAEAGYPDGFKLKVLSRTNALTKTSAVFMTDQLAKIGITAEVNILEDAMFWDTGRKAQHQAMVYTPATVIADPQVMGRFFAPKNPLNFAGNDEDPKLNELWDKQARTVDETARKAAIAEAERYLLTRELPAAPIVWPTSFIAISPQERGFVPGISDYSNNRHQETWLAQ